MEAAMVLRSIVQRRMSPTPFRHKRSQITNLQDSLLLAKLPCGDNVLSFSDSKNEFDDDQQNTSDCGIKLQNMDAETNILYDLISATLSGQFKQNVLLVGPSGFGKSSLLTTVIDKIQNKYGNNSLIYIYLNGRIQTNDLRALYTITQALSTQYDKPCNFVLEDDDEKGDIAYNLAKQLDFVIKELKKVTTQNNKKPVYIVLDNFELFAERKEQTLLYTLTELQQGESLINMICVTGIWNAVDKLQSRVRSRFGHITIFVPQSPLSFISFRGILQDAFTVDYTYLLNQSAKNNQEYITALISKYNAWISEFLQSKQFVDYLQQLHGMGESPAKLLSIGGFICGFIFEKKYFLNNLNERGIIDTIEKQFFEDPFLRMTLDLTTNELLLLIIASKLDINRKREFNFQMLYNKIQIVKKLDSMMLTVRKTQYLECYKSLIDMQFFVACKPTNVKSGNLDTLIPKLLNERYDMMQLNRQIDSMSPGRILSHYVKANIKELPAWMNNWLLDNKTQISFV